MRSAASVIVGRSGFIWAVRSLSCSFTGNLIPEILPPRRGIALLLGLGAK